MNESMNNREFIVWFSLFLSLMDCNMVISLQLPAFLTLFKEGTTNFKKRLPIFEAKYLKTTNKNLAM